MNRNIQIRKDKFDLAKKRIHDLANNVPTVEELPTLETEGGWFGWSDKKVTGAEMNQITRNINNSFIKNNGEIIKIYNQFKEVYNTFDILDKEYIQGIIMATNEAKEASDKAKAISIQAEKNSLQAGEISLQTEKAWKKAEEALNRVIVAQTEKDKIIEALSTNILKLEETKIGIDREFSLLKKRFEEVESIKTLGESIQKSFSGVNQNISTLERFKSRLEEYQHLKDIDVIWESSEEHHKQLASLDSQLSQTKTDLAKLDDTITRSFQETHSEIDMKNELLKKRIYIAYWIAGGALFFSLLQFILLIFKVL